MTDDQLDAAHNGNDAPNKSASPPTPRGEQPPLSELQELALAIQVVHDMATQGLERLRDVDEDLAKRIADRLTGIDTSHARRVREVTARIERLTAQVKEQSEHIRLQALGITVRLPR